MCRPEETTLDWETVQATMDQCDPTVRAMIELQWLTGMRPSEVRNMRRRDLCLAQKPRWYAPHSRSPKHYPGIPLGQRAEAIIWKFLPDELEAYLFNGGDSSEPISADAYRAAIKRACKEADIDPWNAHDLRRAFAERVMEAHGIPAAADALGHAPSNED